VHPLNLGFMINPSVETDWINVAAEASDEEPRFSSNAASVGGRAGKR
jgi:hypothetical protein